MNTMKEKWEKARFPNNMRGVYIPLELQPVETQILRTFFWRAIEENIRRAMGANALW